LKPALCRLALCAALAPVPCAVLAADAFVAGLEQGLASGGVESVNAHLSAGANAAALSRLQRKTAACELHAVSLTLRLARGANARAVQAHQESLRAASGRCARFVLALVSADEVPKVCASQAAWGMAQTARELRRRMADIDADPLLRGTAQGQACRAAYLYELKNTRVTLRVASPRPPAQTP
jgi:CelD/BcsL family acetyltransferase involved in cellulose biosynthesis